MGAISVLSVCVSIKPSFFFLLNFCLLQVETPRALFGVPLISLRESGQMRHGLPLVLTHIVEFVEKHGELKHCRELRKSFDQGGFPEFDSGDILTPASLLKVFLGELPVELVMSALAVKTILNSLPEEHLNVLCYLMFFLSRVAAESHLNLMTSGNLSIVFGPNIFL
uniref:Rho-GAP domain-containing protein n=1 Tax=Cyprinus carpio TaxID=7962 RepID=A0A8C1WAN7_CYPCA